MKKGNGYVLHQLKQIRAPYLNYPYLLSTYLSIYLPTYVVYITKRKQLYYTRA